NIYLIDSVCNYSSNESNEYKSIIKHLNKNKLIPIFIKNIEDFNKFKKLSNNGIYPFSIKSHQQFIEYYNKINDITLLDNNIEKIIEKYKLPDWIKNKIDVQKVFMVLEISQDENNI